MEVQEAIKQRRSVRNYLSDPVPDDKLKRILEAVRLAPSAHNGQNWKFIVVKNEEKRKQLAQAANNQSFVAEAPIVIAAVATEPTRLMSCQVPSYAVDLAIAVDHITLAAVEEELGTCWIGAFDQEKIRELLNIPDYCKVVALLPLGFPADEPRHKQRKPLEEIAVYEEFS